MRGLLTASAAAERERQLCTDKKTNKKHTTERDAVRKKGTEGKHRILSSTEEKNMSART
jgi:hypothetical protein